MPMQSSETLSAEFCFACGRRIDGDIRFCGYCGTSTLAIGSHKVLRYDGVYVTKPQVEHGITSRHYFRFYPDKFVCGISFGSRSDTRIATWWGRRSGGRVQGAYRLDGLAIEMACMGDTQALVYRGTLHKGGLIITCCNGRECHAVYRFVPGREGEHQQEPV
jgi:hypothetical protein